MCFWNSLTFLKIQKMLAIWSLVPVPFLNPAWTPGSSQVTYYWLGEFWALLASVWDECNCAVVWPFFRIAFLWDWMKTDLSQSCGHCWVFQICWHIECSTFTASSSRIWNSSTGISSPPLALFVVMFLKSMFPTWLPNPGRLGLGEWSHHRGYLGHLYLFCIVLCILATTS